MHEHDQDLIMALAEGTLSAAAAAAAEVEFDACAECARDLELQRIAVDLLDDTPRAYLTATESARLHETLHRELNVTSPRPAPTPRQPAWGRWAGLAFGTAAVLLVAFLIIPSLGGLGGDDADMALVATTAASAETSAAPEAAAAPPNREELANAADDTMTLEAGGMAETTAAAAATTTAAPSTEDGSLDAANFLSWFAVGNLDETLRLEVLERLPVEGEAFRLADESLKNINPDWGICIDSLLGSGLFPADSEPQIIGVIAEDSGEFAGMERLLVAFVTPDLGDLVLASVTIPECEVFETLP